MRISRPASLFATLSLFASVLVGFTEANAAGNPNCNAVDGDYIVSFAPGVNVDKEIKDAPGRAINTTHRYDVALNGFAATLSAEQVCAFQKRPNVKNVERDNEVFLYEAQSPTRSWGIDRIDQSELPLNSTYNYPNTGVDVTAYVIDTGIENTHPDLAGRVRLGYSSVGGKATDCNGHGTHVSGTIGGSISGVAKGVQLVAVKVLNCSGSGTFSGVIAGINWVIKDHGNGPAVANMSLGGGFSKTLNDAVANLVTDKVTVALAAGNEKVDACGTSPASTPTAITVAASTSSDAIADFSNFGSCVDLIAPGLYITSAWLKGTYRTISGTSMASPHVAGAAAIYLQSNKSALPATVLAALQGAASGAIATPLNGTPDLLLQVVVAPEVVVVAKG